MSIITAVMPVGDSYDDVYRIEINETTYDFRFRWNTYDECWIGYVGFTGEDPTVKFKVTISRDLLAPYRALDGVPNAVLMVYDEDSSIARVTEDLGQGYSSRFKLLISYKE